MATLKPRLRRFGSSGFTLVELLLAGVLLAITMAGIVGAFLAPWRSSNLAARRDALEASVSEDLSWIRDYSKIWHCEIGPYATAPANTNNGCQSSGSALSYLPAFNSVLTSRYQLFRSWCINGTVRNQFLTEGASTTVPPNRPNPFQIGATTISNAQAPGSSVIRTIALNTSADELAISTGQRLDITYQSPNDSEIQLFRTSSVFVEAASWCP
ncbi:prepilin-type N-terminal cleavage/methylation domain-containing protein [Synechococcus sp. CBW1107]|uniref:prepilin-type N-terminal cleavage/methylation domain-containing protein n=1 Tax=Synechococcus sp. CBW1107 TaxID=2789857 RepID=UPI0018CFC7D7|nr:prepilin-type N-terminal cleavage/methylation domain-containing protein [Synechococcus sp. CBW1107]QPN55795.1 prepilin-type N-terminal cleavage/methylation domain-containing protein [Synechococcus sp. CBW1107]